MIIDKVVNQDIFIVYERKQKNRIMRIKCSYYLLETLGGKL